MPGSEPTPTSILRVVDAVGGLIEFWGFRRAMGRMWAILYLSPQPLAASELGERLAMSTGAVSMTLSELVHWGVVKKSWVPGDRKDYYEPETSIWKMVSRVFRERELAQIRAAIEIFQETLAEIGKQRGGGDEKRRLRFVAERIESLLQLARLGEMLLAAVLDGKKIDLTPLVTFLGT
jgi:HTH-type transcriptional regulator, glycine betaine synthesis regulator